jgi:hypothetical protein
MRNVTKNFENRRAQFDKGLNFYGKNGVVPQRAKLKAVAQIVDGISKLSFSFTKDQSLAKAIEMLVGKTDLFVATAIGFALWIAKDNEDGLLPLLSYPLQDGDHVPACLKGFENGNAFAIYNGKLIMKTGQNVNYSRLPMDDFLYIPETQPEVVMTPSDDAIVSNGVLPAFNIENVMVQTEESILISGTKSQPFDIEFPSISAIDFGIPSGYKAYGVLILDGYMYEGGAAENMKQDGNPYKAIL